MNWRSAFGYQQSAFVISEFMVLLYFQQEIDKCNSLFKRKSLMVLKVHEARQ